MDGIDRLSETLRPVPNPSCRMPDMKLEGHKIEQEESYPEETPGVSACTQPRCSTSPRKHFCELTKYNDSAAELNLALENREN